MSHKSAVFSVEPQSLKPLKVGITAMVYDPTQVKFRVLISSIFDAMNFQHFLEMLEIMFQHFRKMLQIHYIKNARN